MGRPRSAACGEAGAQFAVGGHSAGDEDAVRAEARRRRRSCVRVADDGVLEAGDEVEGLRVAEREGFVRASSAAASASRRAAMEAHVVDLDVAEDGGLDAAEAEEESCARACCWPVRWALDLICAKVKGTARGVAVRGEAVDPGAAGVAEAEELGDFVEGFAGGVVDGVADVAVVSRCRRRGRRDRGGCGRRRRPGRGAGYVVGACRLRFGVLQEDGVDVAFEVVDGDERLAEAEGQGFGVGDADEQRADEAGAFGDGDGVEIVRVVTSRLRRGPRGRRGRWRGGARGEASSGTTPP